MPLLPEHKRVIKQTVCQVVRKKIANYKPESKSMPFHTRLIGKDRLALYSFIHSLNTTFGISIFEPIAVEIAKGNNFLVKGQVHLSRDIRANIRLEIQMIIDELRNSEALPNKQNEIRRIKKFCHSGKIDKIKTVRPDIYLENTKGEIFLADIKTAKPNLGSFVEHKRTLLEWAGIVLTENPSATIKTFIAIPYNPYEPEPYERWTMKGMMDLKEELKVAAEFWNFLGGNNTYEDLLNCFAEAGKELRQEIDDYFTKFQ